jgi:hypothetical protein
MKSIKNIGIGLISIMLFLISVSAFAGENTFYRYRDLKVNTPIPRLMPIGETCQISAVVKNEGGYTGTTIANLYINDFLVDSREVTLVPAEEKEVVFEVVFSKIQMHKITIANLPPYTLRAYKAPLESPDVPFEEGLFNPVLFFSFEKGTGNTVYDLSGHENNGIVKGDIEWVEGIFGRGIRTNAPKGNYIEIPDDSSLTFAESSTLTMMAWVYPMDEKGYADILTKDDWISLQVKANNAVLNFAVGGWQRGEAFGSVPGNWNNNWHHVAGVCDGRTLKLYMDGDLMVTKEISKPGVIGPTDKPWNIGRNATNTERFFNGNIDEVKIFDKALSQNEILQMMLYIK